jgi:hypothetical protein
MIEEDDMGFFFLKKKNLTKGILVTLLGVAKRVTGTRHD